MSILNRLRLNSHLDDAAIAAIWTDSTLDGSRASHPHLGVCTACRTRFDLFSESLDELRDDAAAQADELFPAERLAVQHAQIFRRIEASERPARVIAFPRFRAPLTSRTSHASRWIAAAAAAGLIVGVGVGQVMDLRHIGSVSPAPYPGAPVGTATAGWRSNRAGGGDLQLRRRRSVPLRSRRLALPAVGSGAPRDRRVDAAGRRTATVAVATSQPLIFRKGLDMKEAVAGELATAYHSAIVDRVRASDFKYDAGRLTIHLAREFGFCYGVDRAVDYAYQARRRFPERNVFLTGEIIHNPHVNERLRAAGIRFLSDPGENRDVLGPEDVVILPAFGVTVTDMAQLSNQGCTLVDTTCGSVLNVWKNVVRYAQEGFTSVIHGKVKHEETRATASQALKYPRGRYLVVLDRGEAEIVCNYIRGGGDRTAFLDRFANAASPGFDPDRDLARIGCANQTTMLMTESLEIGEMFRDAIRARYGEAALAAQFRSFDTICSATQERQDAVVALLDEERLDLMLVVGGYNSSNTCNLARICAAKVPHLSHRGPGLHGVRDRAPAPTGGRTVDDSGPGGHDPRLAARVRPRHRRSHGRRLDAQQHCWRSDPAAGKIRRDSVTARRRRAEAHRSMVESSGRPGSDSVIRTACPRFRDRKR